VFKILVFVLAFGSANAATIISTVTCNGQTTSGSFCFISGPNFVDPYASAFTIVDYNSNITVPPFSPLQYFADVTANALGANGGTAHAQISLTETFYLTVTGGTGGGFIQPTILTDVHHIAYGADASGSLYCAGSGPLGLDFTYDVPQECTLMLNAFAGGSMGSGGEAFVGLKTLYFYDNNGPLPVSSYSIVDISTIPEPASFATCGLFLAALLTRIYKQNRSI
jgi:hypothetical protein